MKIILTDSIKTCPCDELSSRFNIIFENITPKKIQYYNNKDSVIAIVGSRALVRQCLNIDFPNCHFIQLFSTGFDNIDPVAFRKKGISLANAKGIYDATLSEYVLFVMLKYAKRYHKSLKNANARPLRNYHYISEIEGKTIGIMGVGQIGSKIARLLSGFDVTIIGYANRTTDKLEFSQIYHKDGLDKFLNRCDFIINTLPHNSGTIGLLGETQFQQFKPNSVFINIGRESIYHSKSLLNFYETNKDAVAILDIFEMLPNPFCRMRRLPNIFITPRISAISKESDKKLKELIFYNICALLENKELKFTIN